MRKSRYAALIGLVCCSLVLAAVYPVAGDSPARIPAFPGAEGGGMYTTGGRGGDVYVVTNLNDSGPGSFREAVSRANRTIIFRVGGVIELRTNLNMADNLTIAGQSAPGDGITIIGRTVNVGNNTIIRYMRFRLGDMHFSEDDAFGGRGKRNIIIDHCSFSWAVDEVISVYNIQNLTIQWSIISEAMHLSTHVKGKHGYGGIWGGRNASFHHNLFAHNSSRNPALDSTEGNSHDFQNNVVYNWGYFGTYGGKGALNNIMHNYYKPGPDTDRYRFMNAETNGSYYVMGNVIEGYPELADWAGVHKYPDYKVLDAPAAFDHPLAAKPAEEAYAAVLAGAGATMPKRDYIDARIVQEVIDGTGRHLNSQREAGGYPSFPEVHADVVDSDGDGMPDEWELASGLNPYDPSDRNGDRNGDGYTNLEEYLHSLAGNRTDNPAARLTAPAYNSIHEAGGSMTIEAEAEAMAGTIVRVDFYANGEKLGEAVARPFQFNWRNIPDGTHYLTAVAVDSEGLAAGASIVPVHVNAKMDLSPWRSVEIGEADIPGGASLADGQFTVKGSGSLGGASDRIHYTYVPIQGDFEYAVRIDEVSGNETGAQGGVMIRAGLEPDAPMMLAGLSYERGGRTIKSTVRHTAGGTAASAESSEAVMRMPVWVKLVRSGDTVTALSSRDGIEWKPFDEQTLPLGDEAYIGMVPSPNNTEAKQVKNYNTTLISEVHLHPLPAELELNPLGIRLAVGDEDHSEQAAAEADPDQGGMNGLLLAGLAAALSAGGMAVWLILRRRSKGTLDSERNAE